MDEKFRSSFIPKQPLVGRDDSRPRYSYGRKQAPNAFLSLSTILFLIAALSYGGVFGYGLLVDRDIQNMEMELEEQRQQFRPAEIAEYKRFDDRLKVAQSILNNHTMASEAFTLLESLTLPSVQFVSFDFSRNILGATETEVDGEIVRTESTERLTILLEGRTGRFEDVALQIEEFEKNQFVRNSSFSNFQLNETGGVSFSVELTLDPALVSYSSSIDRSSVVFVEESVSGFGVVGESFEMGERFEEDE